MPTDEQIARQPSPAPEGIARISVGTTHPSSSAKIATHEEIVLAVPRQRIEEF